MLIQGDTALQVHPVPGVNIDSLNERGAVSGLHFRSITSILLHS